MHLKLRPRDEVFVSADDGAHFGYGDLVRAENTRLHIQMVFQRVKEIEEGKRGYDSKQGLAIASLYLRDLAKDRLLFLEEEMNQYHWPRQEVLYMVTFRRNGLDTPTGPFLASDGTTMFAVYHEDGKPRAQPLKKDGLDAWEKNGEPEMLDEDGLMRWWKRRIADDELVPPGQHDDSIRKITIDWLDA